MLLCGYYAALTVCWGSVRGREGAGAGSSD